MRTTRGWHGGSAVWGLALGAALAGPAATVIGQQPSADPDPLAERLAMRRREMLRAAAASAQDRQLPQKAPPEGSGARPGAGNLGLNQERPADREDRGDAPLTLYSAFNPFPTREEVFALPSTKTFIDQAREEVRRRSGVRSFVTVPGLDDYFDNENSPNLGNGWDQKRTGEDVALMGVRGNRGIYPTPQAAAGLAAGRPTPPDLALRHDFVGSINMVAGVDVELGADDSVFGLVLRAENPVDRGAAIDRLDRPEGRGETLRDFPYYYAAASADQVLVGVVVRGKNTLLAQRQVPAKRAFRLSFSAFGDANDRTSPDTLTVRRDNQVVVTLRDGALKDEKSQYAGLIGLRARPDAPTAFDNFFATTYGGEFAARQFAPSTLEYRGPNVHHGPLRFESRNLERYGHHLGNLAQPFIEQGLFVVDFLALPHGLVTNPPWECVHDDVLYPRPGDVVLPFHLTPPVISKQGVVVQLAVIAAIAAAIP